jgi:hypothetical protein
LDHERDVVDVAVGPVLARLQRCDDRVPAVLDVLGGVTVGRGITAGDVATAAAYAQMHPPTSDCQAVLAAGDLLRSLDQNLV